MSFAIKPGEAEEDDLDFLIEQDSDFMCSVSSPSNVTPMSRAFGPECLSTKPKRYVTVSFVKSPDSNHIFSTSIHSATLGTDHSSTSSTPANASPSGDVFIEGMLLLSESENVSSESNIKVSSFDHSRLVENFADPASTDQSSGRILDNTPTSHSGIGSFAGISHSDNRSSLDLEQSEENMIGFSHSQECFSFSPDVENMIEDELERHSLAHVGQSQSRDSHSIITQSDNRCQTISDQSDLSEHLGPMFDCRDKITRDKMTEGCVYRRYVTVVNHISSKTLFVETGNLSRETGYSQEQKGCSSPPNILEMDYDLVAEEADNFENRFVNDEMIIEYDKSSQDEGPRKVSSNYQKNNDLDLIICNISDEDTDHEDIQDQEINTKQLVSPNKSSNSILTNDFKFHQVKENAYEDEELEKEEEYLIFEDDSNPSDYENCEESATDHIFEISERSGLHENSRLNVSNESQSPTDNISIQREECGSDGEIFIEDFPFIEEDEISPVRIDSKRTLIAKTVDKMLGPTTAQAFQLQSKEQNSKEGEFSNKKNTRSQSVQEASIDEIFVQDNYENEIISVKADLKQNRIRKSLDDIFNSMSAQILQHSQNEQNSNFQNNLLSRFDSITEQENQENPGDKILAWRKYESSSSENSDFVPDNSTDWKSDDRILLRSKSESFSSHDESLKLDDQENFHEEPCEKVFIRSKDVSSIFQNQDFFGFLSFQKTSESEPLIHTSDENLCSENKDLILVESTQDKPNHLDLLLNLVVNSSSTPEHQSLSQVMDPREKSDGSILIEVGSETDHDVQEKPGENIIIQSKTESLKFEQEDLSFHQENDENCVENILILNENEDLIYEDDLLLDLDDENISDIEVSKQIKSESQCSVDQDFVIETNTLEPAYGEVLIPVKIGNLNSIDKSKAFDQAEQDSSTDEMPINSDIENLHFENKESDLIFSEALQEISDKLIQIRDESLNSENMNANHNQTNLSNNRIMCDQNGNNRMQDSILRQEFEDNSLAYEQNGQEKVDAELCLSVDSTGSDKSTTGFEETADFKIVSLTKSEYLDSEDENLIADKNIRERSSDQILLKNEADSLSFDGTHATIEKGGLEKVEENEELEHLWQGVENEETKYHLKFDQDIRQKQETNCMIESVSMDEVIPRKTDTELYLAPKVIDEANKTEEILDDIQVECANIDSMDEYKLKIDSHRFQTNSEDNILIENLISDDKCHANDKKDDLHCFETAEAELSNDELEFSESFTTSILYSKNRICLELNDDPDKSTESTKIERDETQNSTEGDNCRTEVYVDTDSNLIDGEIREFLKDYETDAIETGMIPISTSLFTIAEHMEMNESNNMEEYLDVYPKEVSRLTRKEANITEESSVTNLPHLLLKRFDTDESFSSDPERKEYVWEVKLPAIGNSYESKETTEERESQIQNVQTDIKDESISIKTQNMMHDVDKKDNHKVVKKNSSFEFEENLHEITRQSTIEDNHIDRSIDFTDEELDKIPAYMVLSERHELIKGTRSNDANKEQEIETEEMKFDINNDQLAVTMNDKANMFLVSTDNDEIGDLIEEFETISAKRDNFESTVEVTSVRELLDKKDIQLKDQLDSADTLFVNEVKENHLISGTEAGFEKGEFKFLGEKPDVITMRYDFTQEIEPDVVSEAQERGKISTDSDDEISAVEHLGTIPFTERTLAEPDRNLSGTEITVPYIFQEETNFLKGSAAKEQESFERLLDITDGTIDLEELSEIEIQSKIHVDSETEYKFPLTIEPNSLGNLVVPGEESLEELQTSQEQSLDSNAQGRIGEHAIPSNLRIHLSEEDSELTLATLEFIPQLEDQNTVSLSSNYHLKSAEYWLQCVSGKGSEGGKVTQEIHILLIGTEGQTEWKQFQVNPCQKSQEFPASRIIDRSIGTIKYVAIFKATPGEWYLNYILISTPHNNACYTMPCCQWLSDSHRLVILREAKGVLENMEVHQDLAMMRLQQKTQRRNQVRWAEREQHLPPLPGSAAVPLSVFSMDVSSQQLDRIQAKWMTGHHHMDNITVWQKMTKLLQVSNDDVLLEYEEMWKQMESHSDILESFKHWKKDEEFARKLISAAPLDRITSLREIPKRFSLTDELITESLRNNPEQQKFDQFLLINYADLGYLGDESSNDAENIVEQDKYFCGCEILLQLTQDPEFKWIPLAIRLNSDRPNDADKTYTKNDDGSVYSDWFLAKLLAQVAAINSLILDEFLVYHLITEPIVVSLERNLPVVHPLYKLLKPHLRGLPVMNEVIRRYLLRFDGHHSSPLLEISARNKEKFWDYVSKKCQEVNLFVFDLELRLEMLRISGTEVTNGIIPGCVLFDDILHHWTAVRSFIRDILSGYYEDDMQVASDTELVSLLIDLKDEGLSFMEIPKMFTTLDQLIQFCTTVIYLCTIHPSAVKLQLQFALTISPLPSTFLLKSGTEIQSTNGYTEEQFKNILPSTQSVRDLIQFIDLLSGKSSNKEELVSLVNYPERHFADGRALQAIEKFQECLSSYTQETCKKRQNASVQLLPDNINYCFTI